MFSLKDQQAKLNHVNGRVEKNVEERAFDLKITTEMPNTALNMFHDHLLDAFYKVDPETGHKTALKFLKLAPINWTHEMVGCEVLIGYGTGGESDIVLKDSSVDKFVFTLQAGGTAQVQFRVSAHPAPKDIAKLFELMQGEITVSINPPTIGEQAELLE